MKGVEIALFVSSRKARANAIGGSSASAFTSTRGSDRQSVRERQPPDLSLVDPYGSLILTPEEMEQFVEEVLAMVASDRSADLLDPIFELAAACAADLSTDRHLDGDGIVLRF